MKTIKVSKKILGILLSLVMIISATLPFSNYGFASNDFSESRTEPISVSFVINGAGEPQAYNTSIELSELAPGAAESGGKITVFDAIAYAIDKNFAGNCSWEWDNTPSEGAPGKYFTAINGYETTRSYDEYLNENDGLWHGKTSGEGWKATIDGTASEVYLNHVLVQDVSDIVVTYSPYAYDWVLEPQPVENGELDTSENSSISGDPDILPIDGSLNSYESNAEKPSALVARKFDPLPKWAKLYGGIDDWDQYSKKIFTSLAQAKKDYGSNWIYGLAGQFDDGFDLFEIYYYLFSNGSKNFFRVLIPR